MKPGRPRPRSLKLGLTTIHYDLIVSRRKSVGIIIGRDGQVTVRAPKRLPEAEIKRIIKKKAGWIQRKLTEFEGYPPPAPPRQYISGEFHYYLGQGYPLELLEGKPKAVEFEDSRLRITVGDKDKRDQVKRKLTEWYRAQAQRIYAERLEALYPLIEGYGVAFPPFKVRKMKRRWGSCHANGQITLNLRLIQVPLECIEYVIIHELCHLVQPNHSRRFYALLENLLPDWRDRRERLNRLDIA